MWKRLVRTFFPKPSSAVVWRKTTTILLCGQLLLLNELEPRWLFNFPFSYLTSFFFSFWRAAWIYHICKVQILLEGHKNLEKSYDVTKYFQTKMGYFFFKFCVLLTISELYISQILHVKNYHMYSSDNLRRPQNF